MTRDDVRELMHDYFDGHLSEDECTRVRSFLEEYDNVAEEYRRFNNLLEKVKHLPTGIEVPNGLIAQISDELLSISVAEYESEKQKRLRELSEGKKEGSSRGKAQRCRSNSKRTVAPIPAKTVLLILLIAALCTAVILFFL